MAVAVEHQFGAGLRQHVTEGRGVGQTATGRSAPQRGRMVHEHDATVRRLGQPTEHGFEPPELASSDCARRQKRGGRPGGRDAYDGDRPADAQGRKFLRLRTGRGRRPVASVRGLLAAAQVLRPVCPRIGDALGRIDVVVAGNQRDPPRPAEPFEPRQRVGIFVRQSEIGQVAGNDHVIRRVGVKVVEQRGQYVGPIFPPATDRPGQRAQHPFVQKGRRPPAADRRDVQIGQMGEGERRHDVEVGVRGRVAVRNSRAEASLRFDPPPQPSPSRGEGGGCSFLF